MLGRTSSVEHSGERLGERRRLRRHRVFLAFIVLIFICLGAVVYGLQQSAIRISHVEVLGADASLSAYVTNAMQGSYLGIIPRDSTFFFPEERIRAGILASHGDIAAVSISRNGLTGLSIKADNRVPIAHWCGSEATRFNLNASSTRLNLVADCYIFDTDGFIYATSSEIQSINSFVFYEALVDSTGSPLASSTSPIGSTLPFAKDFPSIFDFARHIDIFGSAVTSVAIHDGEVDDILASGTRITYVLGHEQDAFTALVSARDKFNLADGSVDYLDLRFDGKMYLKKK